MNKFLDKVQQLDEKSDELNDLLGRTPNWVIRWGITLVFVVLGILFIGSILIKYNDIIQGKIIITSTNPPIHVKAKTTGRLSNLFVVAGDSVKKGDLLAEIENTAIVEDVYFLKKKLHKESFGVSTIDSLRLRYPYSHNLGEIQRVYNEFLSAYKDFILFNSLEPLSSRKQSLTKQLNGSIGLLQNQKSQLKLYQKEIDLSKKNYERHKELRNKGVISQSEYEEITRKYLSDKQKVEDIETGISNTNISIANIENLLTQTNIENQSSGWSYTQLLEDAKRNLLNEILQWEQLYIMKSPIDGRITVFEIWNRYQNVEEEEEIFTITPHEVGSFVGKMNIPVVNSSKVLLGQEVLIKLDNYLFEEWGALKGKIISISDVPKNEEKLAYTVYVSIPNLKTTFKKNIDFKQEMVGVGSIIIEELSVMERILYQLIKVFSR